MTDLHSIEGTTVFDGAQAIKGYALNRMCFSLNGEANRKAFLADEEAYFDRYDLTEPQRAPIRRRDVLGMIQAGGNIYYLAKLAGAWGLNVQDVGALQTGTPLEEFKARLLAAAER
jgi:protocatechuate 4,5-dioxygenase alpha chain